MELIERKREKREIAISFDALLYSIDIDDCV